MERFEPYGIAITSCIDKNIDTHIQKLFRENMGAEFIKEYNKPLVLEKYKGFQTKQSAERKSKNDSDPDGFCTAWSAWYTDLRLSNPDKDRDTLAYECLTKIMADETSFTDFIRNYADMIVQMSDDFVDGNYDYTIFSNYK